MNNHGNFIKRSLWPPHSGTMSKEGVPLETYGSYPFRRYPMRLCRSRGLSTATLLSWAFFQKNLCYLRWKYTFSTSAVNMRFKKCYLFRFFHETSSKWKQDIPKFWRKKAEPICLHTFLEIFELKEWPRSFPNVFTIFKKIQVEILKLLGFLVKL